jgi:hypothetical protein
MRSASPWRGLVVRRWVGGWAGVWRRGDAGLVAVQGVCACTRCAEAMRNQDTLCAHLAQHAVKGHCVAGLLHAAELHKPKALVQLQVAAHDRQARLAAAPHRHHHLPAATARRG